MPLVSADQPLTGDELAAIKARATEMVYSSYIHQRKRWLAEDSLRLVAEIEQLRAARDECERQFQAKVAALNFAQGTIDDLAAQVRALEDR